MTPATVHHGQAEQTHAARRAVLEAAYAATPELFARRPPLPPALPTGAWIDKPDREEVAHEVYDRAVSFDLTGSGHRA